MKIGGFKLCEPVQECYEPYVFACLRPWIDVNNVGSLVLGELETQFNAKELGNYRSQEIFLISRVIVQ
ncbi:MAG TPA: hypothetical protein PLL73_07290 [Syntrophorhabdaceae bacterium]|nr:hypothetical protein [Syntrophorhabdaceae bacterium]